MKTNRIARRYLLTMLLPVAMATTSLAAGRRIFFDIEDFLVAGSPILIAKVKQVPSFDNEEWKTASGIVAMKTVQLFSGDVPSSFNLKYTRRLHDARVGKRYLLCLRPRQNVEDIFETHYAVNSVYMLESLKKRRPFFLAAISVIIKTEKMLDKKSRLQVYRNLLKNKNQELQMYAFRNLSRSLYPYHLDNPLDPGDVHDLQCVLGRFVRDTDIAVSVRKYALHKAFFFSIPGGDKQGRRIWPEALISSCLEVAACEPDASMREQAVRAVWGMSQTGLLGPKHSYEPVLPRLTELFAKEEDSKVSKTIAMAITVIGSKKHGCLFDSLQDLSDEKKFYVSRIKQHWVREGEGAINIGGSEFDFINKKEVQQVSEPDKK